MNGKIAEPLVGITRLYNRNNLLFDEVPITLLPTLGHAIGFKEAIVLQKIYEESIKEDNYNPGWAMESPSSIAMKLSYIFPEEEISNIFASLIDRKLLLWDEDEETAMGETSYFSVNFDQLTEEFAYRLDEIELEKNLNE